MFLELERHRAFGIVGEAFRRLEFEGAVRLRLRHVELEFDRDDGGLACRFERGDLFGEHAARIKDRQAQRPR